MKLATMDANRCGAAKRELLAHGGVLQVPYLRIAEGDVEVS